MAGGITRYHSFEEIFMGSIFKPIEVESLKDACLHQLERMIFSGELQVGERLPSERKLAEALDVSRPVLHQALVELEAKGLVNIIPRKGVFIKDYRQVGSIAMLASFLSFNQGELDHKYLSNLLDFRKLLEVETACLAASLRTQEDIQVLKQIHGEETKRDGKKPNQLTELDFSFHLQVAQASGNLLYPLIMNSFKELYTNFTSRFFEYYINSKVVDQVYKYQAILIQDISRKDDRQAGFTMIEMLEHGAKHLIEISDISKPG
jgi:GntR family transcriptional repressor for pyruvate dehydrogenase complex